MKRTTKEIKIVTALVILALVFLCSFNVVYSYFTSVSSINADLDFYTLDVRMYYEDPGIDVPTYIENQTQLYPSDLLKRGTAVNLKSSAEANTNISEIGITSSENSCASYVRFYLQVYMVKEIAGSVYYIDSQGNYVDDNGNYVNEVGEEISSSDVTIGEIVDYAEFFDLCGLDDDGNPSDSERIEKRINAVNNKNYVSYFLIIALTGNSERDIQVNAIRMLPSAPNEILDSDIVIYLTMEAVQASNGAYKLVFNDNYGYYDWES